MLGFLAAISASLLILCVGIRFLRALDTDRRIKLREGVKVLVSTAEQEIGIARSVFRPDFEAKRAELQELIEWVREQFGAELAKNTRELYWIRALVCTLEEEQEWLATMGGLNIQPEARAA